MLPRSACPPRARERLVADGLWPAGDPRHPRCDGRGRGVLRRRADGRRLAASRYGCRRTKRRA
ncbi:MAG: hypothetical protein AVDCRST_MAG40-2706 [uncultured Gemmatimonadaceae bacterium]|uniref:Uncharacterized protein n=1 Tax=uncultured Gemmatimonadaceae bacterium TaxID=246130 RepID=A0A6J4M1L5_9BACT|nr:MAG: hypothetical protein AVDCRST_MAG40-2706 [uncultured Gemmatimonadaceae bacterium]